MYFHYKAPDSNLLEVFEVPDNFFLTFKDFIADMGKRPYWGKSIGFMSDKLPQLKGEELLHKLHEMKTKAGFEVNEQDNSLHIDQQIEPKKNVNFLGRFFSMFNR